MHRRGRPKFLYYAFGGGLGHGARILALTRQLARLIGGQHLVLLNTPFARTLRSEIRRQPLLEARFLAPGGTPNRAEAFVRDAFSSFRPDVLIVDTFPRGLAGELVKLFSGSSRHKRVLISRHLPAEYVEAYGLTEFVRSYYSLVIAPGELSPFEKSMPVISTRPFLLRDLEELPSQARQMTAKLTAKPPLPPAYDNGARQGAHRIVDIID